MSKDRFQILSLDGGGIKGIFSAAILTKIEEDLNIKIGEHFDLISGTSTGGIIAIGLGLGLRPRQILNFYIQNGPQIFSWPRLRDLLHPFVRKYSRKNLEVALEKCFDGKRFGDSKKRLIIPSYSLSNNDVYLFRTSHCEHLYRDYKLPAKNVALATGAAPTYFSSYKLDGKNRLIDGGVWANNPTMVAISEAVGFLSKDLKDISVLSLGTTNPVKKRPSFLNWGGYIPWAKTAPDLIMDGQSIAATNQANIFLGKDKVLRINANVTDGEFALDRVSSADSLLEKADHISRTHLHTVKTMFLDHVAPEFVPIRRCSETEA